MPGEWRKYDHACAIAQSYRGSSAGSVVARVSRISRATFAGVPARARPLASAQIEYRAVITGTSAPPRSFTQYTLPAPAS